MSAKQNVITFEISRALLLRAEHCALLEVDASDVEIDAVLHRYVVELRRLATSPATTIADLHEKAHALATCLDVGRNGRPTVSGDQGLAASLIADILALT